MACCGQVKDCCSEKSANLHKKLTIVLVGNPNCGKTTLFNALTGTNQKIGNWPGVTVEKKSGLFAVDQTAFEVIDLPGIYSLLSFSKDAAIDESIACENILSRNADVYVNIIDASNLERNLYLTLQLLEMGLPVIVALNMMDVAEKRGIEIDPKQLSADLNCPVIPITANKKKGVEKLKLALMHFTPTVAKNPHYFPKLIQDAMSHIADEIETQDATFLSARLLEDDLYAKQFQNDIVLSEVKKQKAIIAAELGEDADILMADARYAFIETILKRAVTATKLTKRTWHDRIDDIVLNRFLGIPIFLFIMYCLFLFSINIGGAFQDFFDISSNTIFVEGLAQLLSQLHAPNWLIVLVANGVGKGINTTITFIPVIGAMFLFLAALEDSGYMARAAFVVDRLMQTLGLPGKAFVPMIVGFGCNVPAVMAARTLDNKRDRILTIMMSPFMSCGARLAIFAIFTAAFFPQGGHNIIFALYLIGILTALLTGFLLRKTILQGEPAPLLMELPTYHLPQLKTLLILASQRLKLFVFRAGKLIVPICVLIGALNAFNINGTLNGGEGDADSLLSLLGQWVTPIFSPMGIQQSNWPATVGLLTGILAKEVVVGTLNTLYTQIGHLTALGGDTFHFWGGLKEACLSIPDNFAQLGSAFSNPVLAKAPIDPVNQGVYGIMYKQFDGQVGAFAYLLFVLLYFPCVSTTAAMLRELHRGWAIFSVLWTSFVAYAVAVLFYQAATFFSHPFTASLWLFGLSFSFLSIVFIMRWLANESTLTKHVGEIA